VQCALTSDIAWYSSGVNCSTVETLLSYSTEKAQLRFGIVQNSAIAI